MHRHPRVDRRAARLVAGLVAVLAIAVPVIAADHSPSGDPPGQAAPDASAKPARPDRSANPDKSGKPGRGQGREHAGKRDKRPELPKTLRGSVEQATDRRGRPTFTLTAEGVTWELSAGPKWFHGRKNPLAAFVGKTVEVAGTYHEGETELDVETVDGQPIRKPGKPPWAGGPWIVGEGHPGWKPWKADGHPGRGHGREQAPGQKPSAPAQGG